MLVWPAKLNSLPLIHALANVERNFARDLRGLRTLLFPGTHSSRSALQATLANRTQLAKFYQSLWVTQSNANTTEETCTSSPSFLAALGALNDIQNRHPDVANPSLAELVPVFVFDTSGKGWSSPVASPLERTLSKVAKLAHRRDLRDKVNIEWPDPRSAPGALMVLHNTTKKNAWQNAFATLSGTARPEALLLDATTAAMRTNYAAVHRIPDLLKFSRENGSDPLGALVLTDDPKMFFVLRAKLSELKLSVRIRVWAAESENVLLSPQAVSDEWQPELRSNANFSVSIVDRDASQVALSFQRLAQEAGNEESPGHKAMMDVCLYLLRLSNMPAGYSDLTSHAAEGGDGDFASQRNAWAPLRLAVHDVLASGSLNSRRAEVENAIRKAEALIDAWNDATPMALRLLTEVQKYASHGKRGLSIVLPNRSYAALAHRFLLRKFTSSWPEIEPKLEWHTQASVGKTITGERKGKHFVFVGVNSDVLRILLAHPDLPHGTAVFVAYKQAKTTLETLLSMKTIDAFKPYRGRIGLLAQELDRRLKEVPNPLVIDRLGEMTMTFKLDDSGNYQSGGEQGFYKFELEGGGRAYASGYVYRYESDEDPFFRRTPASSISPGDFIFDMSDELRAKLEGNLRLTAGVNSTVEPMRMLLNLYHKDIETRCSLLFRSTTSRAALARLVHAKMIEIDSRAADCSTNRVYYWLAPRTAGDTAPHASKDATYFKFFCKALTISDDSATQYWIFIRNARRLNQSLGRILVARYAEILFQPESALAYRKIPEEVIEQLQEDALQCVYRIEKVTAPVGA